ncbi:GNAT family N-acetyltransferase [Kribbella sp.]|uniref:GNAT family N-acetyltransferase n=1 Tax=Kribbella sp. TaxID=1871183 RepID=UPI002D31ACAC|nr:GNAT family N-acetyltransferase [Kribbella sp.]HZX09188.1 GNAT family N-acetyltransferase [Kribbella sp.]
MDDPRFVWAYPVWTMTHDGTTRPSESELPAPLRYGELADVPRAEFSRAYASAYRDQRLVEPAESWDGPADRSVLALAPDGSVAGFVLAKGDRSVELGPIGTVPAWRGRGVGSALLSSMLARCRGRDVHLTVDGESPTRAQELYLRYGFRLTERSVAYQVRIS